MRRHTACSTNPLLAALAGIDDIILSESGTMPTRPTAANTLTVFASVPSAQHLEVQVQVAMASCRDRRQPRKTKIRL